MAKENENKGMDLHSLYKKTGAFPPKLQNSLGSIIGYDPFTLIYAHQDRFISVKTFEKRYPMSSFVDATDCRGIVDPINPNDCEVILTCAHEMPNDYCSAVDVTIGYQVIVPKPYDPSCSIVFNDKVYCSFEKFTSLSHSTFGDHVYAKEALKIADGSCVQVYINCYPSPYTSELIVKGFIIDKLWKKENLLIAASAFRLNNTVTVGDEFEQAPGACPYYSEDPVVTDLDLNE